MNEQSVTHHVKIDRNELPNCICTQTENNPIADRPNYQKIYVRWT